MADSAAVVRVRTPGDIAATVPYLLGFVPQESVVVVHVHGRRSRAGLTLRIDLPDPGDEAAMASMLADRAAHEKPREVYLFVFTEAPDVDGDLPRRELYDALCAAMPIRVVDGLLIRAGRWWSYACGDPRCCPPEGGRIDGDSSAATTLAAAHALHGRAVLADRAAVLNSIMPLGGITARSMAQAVQRVVVELIGASREEQMRRSEDLVEEVLARYEDPRAVLSHDEAAILQLVWSDVVVRDAVLARCVDDALLDRVYRLVRDVARRAVPGQCAPAWAMLGWAAYVRGDGIIVTEAAEHALRCDPEYSLAHLLLECLDAQVSPDLLRASCMESRM